MSNKQTLPKRDEIPSEAKWKLEDIYPSDQDWEADFQTAKQDILKVLAFKDNLTESADNLLTALEVYITLQSLIGKIYSYAHMRKDQDNSNTLYQSLTDRAQSLSIEADSASAYIVPSILTLEKKDIDTFIEEAPKLKKYNFYFEQLLRQKEHILSTEVEEILAMAGEIASAPGKVFSMLNNADIKFPFIKGENGEEIELTKGRYSQLMESRNRQVRQDAFKALYETYAKQKNTLASLYSSEVKANNFFAKVRKYPSALVSSLDNDNISVEVYDNLIKAVHNNLSAMYKYISLRKKALGLDEIHMYDLYVPIVKDFDFKIQYEEAVKMVKEGLHPLGETYLNDLDKGFHEGWIDIYENEGKTSGAYSWGCYDVHPFVLLNYQDNINNVFTLAHEMGHAMHSYYSNANQEYIYSHYPIFLAEVASTTNEALLMDYLLKKSSDKKEKMALLNHYLEQFRGTVYRQTMFAEFEKICHEKASNGEPLTPELLAKIYHDLNVLYYGSDVVIDTEVDIEWARIPHFYNSFYVYKYATGFSAAVTLSQQIIKEGEAAVKRYLEFLSSGGSDYPLNLLKKAGADLSTPAPIESALKVFASLVDEMEKLMKE